MRINTAYLCLLPYCVFFYLCFCVRRILQATMTDAAESQAIVFDDIFTATQLNPEGKYFDKVNRVVGKGETFEADLTLDIASEIYPIREGDKFTMALASTLRLDGQPDDGTYDQSGVSSLLDKYEYGMSGKVFRYEYSGQDKVYVHTRVSVLACTKVLNLFPSLQIHHCFLWRVVNALTRRPETFIGD
eukprot:gb/GECG01012275.1/.p1 GENE.gb/GECG01012275.1/~~gb/GECG01012275.1/.p1  ORF type:complete len:188 (+),score=11.69 gb/GECG01012275.1/:1-564(+)